MCISSVVGSILVWCLPLVRHIGDPFLFLITVSTSFLTNNCHYSLLLFSLKNKKKSLKKLTFRKSFSLLILLSYQQSLVHFTIKLVSADLLDILLHWWSLHIAPICILPRVWTREVRNHVRRHSVIAFTRWRLGWNSRLVFLITVAIRNSFVARHYLSLPFQHSFASWKERKLTMISCNEKFEIKKWGKCSLNSCCIGGVYSSWMSELKLSVRFPEYSNIPVTGQFVLPIIGYDRLFLIVGALPMISFTLTALFHLTPLAQKCIQKRVNRTAEYDSSE